MDWWIGGIVVVLVIAIGVGFASRTRRPERLVTPSPLAGWDEALAAMPKASANEALPEGEDCEASVPSDTKVPLAGLPPLKVDFDLDLDTPASAEERTAPTVAPTGTVVNTVEETASAPVPPVEAVATKSETDTEAAVEQEDGSAAALAVADETLPPVPIGAASALSLAEDYVKQGDAEKVHALLDGLIDHEHPYVSTHARALLDRLDAQA